MPQLLQRVFVLDSDRYLFVCHNSYWCSKGPLHGGANERVFDMLKEIRESGDVNAICRKKSDSKEKIMDLEHRVYKKQDPREIFFKRYG